MSCTQINVFVGEIFEVRDQFVELLVKAFHLLRTLYWDSNSWNHTASLQPRIKFDRIIKRPNQAISLGGPRFPGTILNKRKKRQCRSSARRSAPIALKTSEIDSLQFFTSKLCTNFFSKLFFSMRKIIFRRRKYFFHFLVRVWDFSYTTVV